MRVAKDDIFLLAYLKRNINLFVKRLLAVNIYSTQQYSLAREPTTRGITAGAAK